MDEYTLQLTFTNEAGDKVSFSIPNAKQTVTEAEIGAAMDAIILNAAFTSTGGALVSKSGAQLVRKNVTAYTVA